MLAFFLSILVLSLARLSTAQYAGTLDVNDPNCPRRNGPHLRYKWTFDRAAGHHCFKIPMQDYSYHISMAASRHGPAPGAPDVFGICDLPDCRSSNCTYWTVAADDSEDHLNMACQETSGTKYIYIGR